MKRAYVIKNLQRETLRLILRADEIINEYIRQGYDITLRQLYYQFVARDIIPNTQEEYKRLQTKISDGRLCGYLDWDALVDRTREYESLTHWENPQEILDAAVNSYKIDTRKSQSDYIEVWVEKDALLGVVSKACKSLDVGYMSCRGFISQSAIWRAAKRLIARERHGKKTYVIHLSDHDPSGIDMSRDIAERLILFGCEAQVERIALTMEQIQEHQPPPNPAKESDSRYERYARRFGDECWELDALDPGTLTDIITESVEYHTEKSARTRLIKQQERERRHLKALMPKLD